uniref:Uncharacterized protein n=1 Tax=Eucampia antarctica TaxID=49252 RepID=A0A7S2VYS7_9STRA|mmetsp:Transcript_11383/g.10891  ORF Transcript_11383/g.10891 Transcript_11383/m.10891 type:complete len:149 (+) Transcript_11383:210-656(+)|eukprot:CAMPEP_0197824390 /NCGR_PEP_ID=MMETSP1437-20131217/1643_1 /TAXON_ID=49252 ORGANISM="Eucampia antarctica, Strain CCMP1452" /NCGR_SAMPLE_ID=MMETSP1437 /ASSEMBLY_ACC=CAM_ASM_001096 /LENGTH=148 /DNA_ID=CAMNT_0043423997 /DNA_START=181 /DNA_END=627 /DNA_ORIENTATION=-
MSTKLVKRLLQETLELKEDNNEEVSPRNVKRKKKSSKSLIAKKSDDDPMQTQVESILVWDRALQSREGRKNKALKRKTDSQKKETKHRKEAKLHTMDATFISNSRTSSSKRSPLQPTVTKRTIENKRKIKDLKELAAALKKTSRKRKT